MIERCLILGLFVVVLVAAAAPADEPGKSVSKRAYGKTADGQPVDEYTLSAGAMTVKLITYGAAISEFHTPDQLGRPTDVVLGFDDMAGWQSKGNPYFGAIVGRVANRIAGGNFTLNGHEYKLAVNNGPNSLHGGNKGFDKVVWKAEEVPGAMPSVRFTYRSPDGEEGYPGNLTTQGHLLLDAKRRLTIEYEANTDKPTPINLTNHAYFNLNGAKSGSTILNHLLTINARKYTPTDANLIPTGQLAPRSRIRRSISRNRRKSARGSKRSKRRRWVTITITYWIPAAGNWLWPHKFRRRKRGLRLRSRPPSPDCNFTPATSWMALPKAKAESPIHSTALFASKRSTSPTPCTIPIFHRSFCSRVRPIGRQRSIE